MYKTKFGKYGKKKGAVSGPEIEKFKRFGIEGYKTPDMVQMDALMDAPGMKELIANKEALAERKGYAKGVTAGEKKVKKEKSFAR